MSKIAIVIHGGAGPDSDFIKQNIKAYEKGLAEAVNVGYAVLEDGGDAVDAVEASVNYLEDNFIFSAGRGSALNENAEVEMGASIMNGKDGQCGGVAIVKNVKNPVTLARAIMEKTKHIYLGAAGALKLAEKINLKICPDAYFITDHAFEDYMKTRQSEGEATPEDLVENIVRRKAHGTVGAVALDSQGNVAAATSTGGLENKLAGRIADSSMVGIGSYANNNTCAVSCTGDGEYLMRNVVSFHVSSLIEYKGLGLKEACDFLLHDKLKHVEGDMGIIAIDPQGNIAMEFNSERMHRGWKTSDGEQGVLIYK